MQTTNTVLMIAPVQFGFNPDAAETNSLYGSRYRLVRRARQTIQTAAREEFTRFVEVLREVGISVMTVEDTSEPHTPVRFFRITGFPHTMMGALSLPDGAGEPPFRAPRGYCH